MSMQRECGIVELEPGRWFCLVADREYGELDEGCTAYGPKSTAEGAWEAMADCESNPGGHWTYTWDSMGCGDSAGVCGRCQGQSGSSYASPLVKRRRGFTAA